jgi:hypothetical protein
MRPSPRPAIAVHIGELRISGRDRREGARLAGAFERELGRLLEQSAAWRGSYHRDHLRLEPFVVRPGERPERTGVRLARLIARELAS